MSWFYKPTSIKKLCIASVVILLATLVAEYFIHFHKVFSLAHWFGFNAVYGFLSCVLMVVFAKLLGFLVKRREDYYD